MTEKVKEYNELVNQAQAKGLTQFKTVKRFSDDATAEKRLATLKAALGTGVAQAPAAEAKPEQAQEQQPQPKEAKKAANKKAAKKNSKKQPAKAEATNGKKKPTEIEEILGARSNGTKKAKLLGQFLTNKGKKLQQDKLVSHVYGNTNKESVNSFSNCIGGLIKTVAKHGRYKIDRQRNDKEVTFALVPKG